jgi:hypothetical protein
MRQFRCSNYVATPKDSPDSIGGAPKVDTNFDLRREQVSAQPDGTGPASDRAAAIRKLNYRQSGKQHLGSRRIVVA